LSKGRKKQQGRKSVKTSAGQNIHVFTKIIELISILAEQGIVQGGSFERKVMMFGVSGGGGSHAPKVTVRDALIDFQMIVKRAIPEENTRRRFYNHYFPDFASYSNSGLSEAEQKSIEQILGNRFLRVGLFPFAKYFMSEAAWAYLEKKKRDLGLAAGLVNTLDARQQEMKDRQALKLMRSKARKPKEDLNENVIRYATSEESEAARIRFNKFIDSEGPALEGLGGEYVEAN